MIHPIFAVYDSKAKYFGAPFPQQNSDVAIRAFTQAANTPGNPIHDHSTDFALIEIASFDDENGTIVQTPHVNHGLAATFKSREVTNV